MMEEKKWTLYVHIAPNNKQYVGITSREVNQRWKNGFGYKNNEYFMRAIDKYGWNNFQHLIIANDLSYSDACKYEKLLISIWKTQNYNFGYNNSCGGECGTLGVHLSKSTRQKMSKAHTGVCMMTEDGIKRLRESKLGDKNPNYGKPGTFLGKHHSEETKEKMRQAWIRRKQNGTY